VKIPPPRENSYNLGVCYYKVTKLKNLKATYRRVQMLRIS